MEFTQSHEYDFSTQHAFPPPVLPLLVTKEEKVEPDTVHSKLSLECTGSLITMEISPKVDTVLPKMDAPLSDFSAVRVKAEHMQVDQIHATDIRTTNISYVHMNQLSDKRLKVYTD